MSTVDEQKAECTPSVKEPALERGSVVVPTKIARTSFLVMVARPPLN